MSHPAGSSTTTGPVGHPNRRRTALTVVAVLVGLAGLIGFGFMLFVARLMSFGLYSWTEPRLDPAVWLPVLGGALVLVPGPLVMSLGPNPRRWRIVAVGTFVAGAVIVSAASWLAVLAERA